MASRFENCIRELARAGKISRELADSTLAEFNKAKADGLDDVKASLRASETVHERALEARIEGAGIIVSQRPSVGIQARLSELGPSGGSLKSAFHDVKGLLDEVVAAREAVAPGSGKWLERTIEETIGALVEAKRLDKGLPAARDELETPLEILSGRQFAEAHRVIASLFFKVPTWLGRLNVDFYSIFPSVWHDPQTGNKLARLTVIRERLRGFLDSMRDPRVARGEGFDLFNTDGNTTRAIVERAPIATEWTPVQRASTLDAARALVLRGDFEMTVGVAPDGSSIVRKASEVLAEHEQRTRAAHVLAECATGGAIG